MNSTRASVSHHERLIEELRDDPAFARGYLAEALAQADEPGGREALLLVLRQLAEAHGGMAKIAEAAGVRREALYRALSPKGNPTLSTLLAVLGALGVRLSVEPHPDTTRPAH